MEKVTIKQEDDFHCDECGACVDTLYYQQDGKEICEICKKGSFGNDRREKSNNRRKKPE